MFQRFKSKPKVPSLRIPSRSADSKGTGQATETISMANMPLVSHNATMAVLPNTGLGLHTAQTATAVTSVPTAKKSLDFGKATAPPEQIVVYDTAVQTVTVQQTPAQLAVGGATGTSMQTKRFIRHPNTVQRREERQLCRVFLPRDLAHSKQFQPRLPLVNQKQYPIIRFLADAYFSDVATQLNELVRFFDLNTIGPFMYDEDLEFFIARFQQVNSARWPYLRHAIKYMYEKHYLRNRTRPNQPEDGDGEWMNIEDDTDDEIAFQANTDPQEVVLNEQFNDTLPYIQTPRQQDECQDQPEQQGDDPMDINWLDDAEYQTLDPPDQFDDTFYTINDYWTDDNDAEALYDVDSDRQVDRDEDDSRARYVTHIQDGYTLEQVNQETCDMNIGPVPGNKAQEVLTAYPNLDLTRATEAQPH